MYDHIATPAFEEIKLKHFIVSEEGSLVCFWMPTAASVGKIAAIAEKVNADHGLPLVVDIGTGNGFLPFLLARTGRVLAAGVDPNQDLISRSRFSHPNLDLVCADAAWAVEKYRGYASLVVQSWPPLGHDLTRHIKGIDTKAIVNIFDHNCYSGRMNKYRTVKGYHKTLFWEGPSAGEISSAFLERGSSFDGNQFEVHLRNGAGEIQLVEPEVTEEYLWVLKARERFGSDFINKINNAEKVRRV